MKFLKRSLILIAALFSMTFAAADTAVFNSTVFLEWYPTVTVDASKFSNFKSGDKIVLSYENVSANYHQIKLYSGDWFGLYNGNLSGGKNQVGSFIPDSDSGTMIYTVTSEEAKYVKKSGLRFHGYGMKINRIGISSGSEKSTESKSTKADGKSSVLFDSVMDLDWNSNITIPKEKFSSFASGGKIQFTYSTNAENYHNIKIYSGTWNGFSQGKIEGAANNSGVFVPNGSSGTILYSPSASELSELKSKGLIVHGFGVTLKKIEIVGAEAKSETKSTGAKSTETTSVIKPTEEKSGASVSSNPKPASVTGTPFANHGALHVDGAYLYDSHNKKYQLYGMSTHGINFGNDFSRYVNKSAFQTLRDDWNTNCIRLVLYPRDYNGYCNGGNKSELKKIVCNGIDWATELGMYVIVDWHVHQYRPSETQSDAISFLDEISKKYARYENVLYEICNEPTNSPWNSEIKPYAEKVISVIRKNAPNAVVLVGTNTWSQDIEEPLANPLSFKNVMYVFHFYANTHQASYRNRVENAIKKGLPVFITEFGTCDASGNGGFNSSESKKWFDLCKKYNISHMNWSLSNKNESASAISNSCGKTSGWTTADLSQSGKLVYDWFRTLSR